MNKQTLADLADDLDGYRSYAPTGLCAGIDESVADENPCDFCGGRCCYRGFRSGDSYRAFAICLSCNACFEF